LALCYSGALEEAAAVVEPLRSLGPKIAEMLAPMPFAGWQTAFDPLLTPGARNYWKSHNFTALSDAAIDVAVDYVSRLPSPECEVFMANLGGAVNRVPVDATAYPHRNVEFVMNVHTRWRDAAQDDQCIGWAREMFDAMAPHATGAVYVNFMPSDEAQRVRAGAYGPNYDRLAELKAKYDPQNLFRLNQNVAP
jgi:FAD/FMN-containing dehydrogenase